MQQENDFAGRICLGSAGEISQTDRKRPLQGFLPILKYHQKGKCASLHSVIALATTLHVCGTGLNGTSGQDLSG